MAKRVDHLKTLRGLRDTRELARARLEAANQQILEAVREARKARVPATEICEALSISRSTFYEFLQRDGGG